MHVLSAMRPDAPGRDSGEGLPTRCGCSSATRSTTNWSEFMIQPARLGSRLFRPDVL